VTASAGGSGATAGTVYLLENNASLYVPTALFLPPDTHGSYADVTVENGATLTLGGGASLTVAGTLRVTGNSRVLVQSKNNGGLVDGTWQGVGGTIAAHTLQVDLGSQISADAQGYTTFQGPGGGDFYMKGGTYGGSGRNNTTPTYGSPLTPTDLGSGGGAAGGTSPGGGAIRVIVTGALTNNGTITADGGVSEGTGGGSGGSIYVTAGTLAGVGTFTADGTLGPHNAGGGGRIAIYYATSTFNHGNITASAGGAGATAGSVALVVSPPTLTGVLPASASIGTAVTLTGTGFTWATQVRFNAAVQPVFAIVSDAQITTTVPAFATSGPLQVVTAGGTATSATSFVVIPPAPTLTGISPVRGGAGAAVTLTGTGFTWVSQVLFNATSQPAFTIVSDTQITTTLPAGASSGPVHVVNATGTATSAVIFAVIIDGDLDGLPDGWEAQFGLDPTSGVGDSGLDGDPDGDGRTNLEEYEAGTHPRGFFTRHLAEGATIGMFDVRLALLNAGGKTALVNLRFLRASGAPVPYPLSIPPSSRRTVRVNDVDGMGTAEFSTVIESDVAVIVDRTMSWDLASGYGGHAETSVPSPALRWYLAEGATHSAFNLFYLLQNSNSVVSQVRVRYLRPAGAPIEKTYALAPDSRTNIWVDLEEFDGQRLLASTDVSAVFDVLNGQPIIVERAMYADVPGQTFGAGHESAGVTAPALEWFLAEGATGSYFDLFVLIANPGAVDAQVEATYLLPDGRTITKACVVAANSRFNIWVDYEDAHLANTAVSTTIRSTNGVPVIVERAMWWPDGGWFEAHNSPGATATGTTWALAEGEVGGPRDIATYVLVANTSAWEGTVRVTLLFEDGTRTVRAFTVAGNSRFNVDVRTEFPSAIGKRFGAIVESLGSPPAQIVVERAMYWDASGQDWAAGTNALATRLK
jgi:hypothetical protein